MDTPNAHIIGLRSDGTRVPLGEKSVIKSYTIPKRVQLLLEQPPYCGNSGTLVRLLLEAYFKDQLPLVKLQFNKLYQKSLTENGAPNVG